MYKVNFYLKIFIILLVMMSVAMTFNYYILWALLIALSIFNFFFNNKKILLIDCILVTILLLSYIYRPLIYVYKIAFIVNIIISFIDSFTSKEKKFFKILFKDMEKKNRRNEFYEQKYNYILETNKKLSNEVYKIDLINEDKINSDLERHYLQSKIRFNGYCDIEDKKVTFKWTYIDTIILIVSIILFVLCIIFR